MPKRANEMATPTLSSRKFKSREILDNIFAYAPIARHSNQSAEAGMLLLWHFPRAKHVASKYFHPINPSAIQHGTLIEGYYKYTAGISCEEQIQKSSFPAVSASKCCSDWPKFSSEGTFWRRGGRRGVV